MEKIEKEKTYVLIAAICYAIYAIIHIAVIVWGCIIKCSSCVVRTRLDSMLNVDFIACGDNLDARIFFLLIVSAMSIALFTRSKKAIIAIF